MNKLFLITLLIFTVVGCLPSRYKTKLSDFKINNKSYNRFIENRIPEYGDGNRDGCVVMNEASLHLDAIGSDTISGIVTDTESGEPLNNAQITLIKDNPADSIKTNSDSKGRFEYNTHGQIKKLTVDYIGYRSLIVDLSKLN